MASLSQGIDTVAVVSSPLASVNVMSACALIDGSP
jgi:hypothetical protein